VNDRDQALYEHAQGLAANAYAPYSRFHVGAAVRTRDGRIFGGVNVENAAYPLGICAERAAVAGAVAAGLRPGELDAIAITASPCGGCRQWLLEFGLGVVVYRNNKGEVVAATPQELLPDSFTL
jgi:cytidine deaminase